MWTKLTKEDLEAKEQAQQDALNGALTWLAKHEDVILPKYLVLVNMREPSYRKRLYLYDNDTKTFVVSHNVAHGEGSCKSWFEKAYADKFSNEPESHKTSTSMMECSSVYTGKHGKSRRLKGLDKGVNDNVEIRDIVLHAANYMTDPYILQMGRAGCSFGCFAMDPAIWYDLCDLLVEGTLLYCHY